MADDSEPKPDELRPANDNSSPAGAGDDAELTAKARLDKITLEIARSIGRQLAREAFETMLAANDNGTGRQDKDGRGNKDDPPQQ